MATPQFGEAKRGVAYADRPAAFGIALRDGLVATVRVEKAGHAPWHDLPGGAVDPGEDHAQAVVREFGEEAGLIVVAGGRGGGVAHRAVSAGGAAGWEAWEEWEVCEP